MSRDSIYSDKPESGLPGSDENEKQLKLKTEKEKIRRKGVGIL